MSKYVPDISSKRWVIIAPKRLKRPEDHQVGEKKPQLCPFCENNESLTPPEVFRIGQGSQNQPGWQVRVIPNKFPITDIHEVIIHSPDHYKDFIEFDLDQIERVFQAYRQRFNFYKEIGHVLIFCNHGEHSGASLTHPHSQLVVIPSQINLDTLAKEPLNNIIDKNQYFIVYCPDFSQWPYEVWITPKEGDKFFGEITYEEISDLSAIIKKVLTKLRKIAFEKKLIRGNFAYNFYIYPGRDWYLRIIPRLIHRAGFELGSGLSVNIIDPTQAAEEIKD